MGKNTNFVSHKKSKLKENGGPKLPLASDLVEGEIAINFGKDVETLSIKNESGNVVTFSSDNYYTEKKLGSGFTSSNSAMTVTEALTDLDERKLDASAYTPSVELWVSGTGLNSVVLKGSSGTASGDYSVAMGSGTTASSSYSVAEGIGTTTSGDYSSHAEGNRTIASGGYGSHAEGDSTKAIGYSSHAEGMGTTASGSSSHAEGNNTQANGDYSHAEGYNTFAINNYSHAEGYQTKAIGYTSHTEGNNTQAIGNASHAEGQNTIASGDSSHAEGYYSKANGDYSHAEGQGSNAVGNYSHAEGQGSNAVGNYSHAEGQGSKTVGQSSHAEGYGTSAMTYCSHAEGNSTITSGQSSHAEGNYTQAIGNSSHAEGNLTTASGSSSHVEGNSSKANGDYSHAEGSSTANGNYSHAEGQTTTANGYYSHTEGSGTRASGDSSHAEGYYSKANGDYSHAEGYYSKANGNYSHAEGRSTIASGNHSHAEGNETTASGVFSHTEGYGTTASGQSSHAEGYQAKANGNYSHAEGYRTVANNESEHASGQYNVSNSATTEFGDSGNTLFSVGNGNFSTRHNAFEIRQNGDIYITSGNSDIKLQDYIGSVETVTAITPSNSGSTDPIATKVVAENELTVSNALNDLDIRKLNISNFNTYSGGVDTAINSKASQSDLTALSGTVTGHTSNANIHLTTTEKTNLDSLATNIGTISGITSTDKLIHETMNRRTRTDFTSKGLEWFKNTLKSAIADKSLEKYGLKVGDYCSVTHGTNTYNYVIAGLNTMRGTSTPYRLNYDHVGIIVDTNITHKWNERGNTYQSTNTYSTGGTWTTGASAAGYANCDLHYYLTTTVLGNVKTDLGSDNIKSHYKLYSNAVNTSGHNRYGSAGGCSSGWAWYENQEICALSEVQVYGSIVWSSSGYDTGEACRQLDVFRVYNMNEIFEGRYPWLRDVASASFACYVDATGHATYNTASSALYVAALILFA